MTAFLEEAEFIGHSDCSRPRPVPSFTRALISRRGSRTQPPPLSIQASLCPLLRNMQFLLSEASRSPGCLCSCFTCCRLPLPAEQPCPGSSRSVPASPGLPAEGRSPLHPPGGGAADSKMGTCAGQPGRGQAMGGWNHFEGTLGSKGCLHHAEMPGLAGGCGGSLRWGSGGQGTSQVLSTGRLLLAGC